jgi:two-component system chemotaxis response regulator CheB
MSETTEKIRVLVVDDSPVARELITRVLALHPGIEVVGTARDGREAVKASFRLRPSLITMDIYMPEMDGLAAIQEIMATAPRPILVVTSDKNSKLAYRALHCGALDVMEKPRLVEEPSREAYADFLDRVRLLAGVRVITHVRGRRQVWSDAFPPMPEAPRAPAVVGIGASTGGPSVLARILADLDRELPAGLLVVQHLSEGFTQGLVQWLDECSRLKVKEAMNGDLIEPHVVYVAPSDHHAEVAPGGRILLSQKPLVNGHRPSADVLFSSMARACPNRSMGVLLTGMGADGAAGLKELRDAGGRTIAQDEETSLIFGMPKVAIELGAAEHVVPAPAMAEMIRRLLPS